MTVASTRTWRCGPGAYQAALDEFRRMGGSISGGESDGKLTIATPLGRLEGTYLFDGEELTITITERPMMVPITMIWSRLDQLCGPPVMKA